MDKRCRHVTHPQAVAVRVTHCLLLKPLWEAELGTLSNVFYL